MSAGSGLGRTVSVLGTLYSIIFCKYEDDPKFKKHNICGYCDSQSKRIVVCDATTIDDGWDREASVVEADNKETLRHEIIHAFFDESGLCCSCLAYDGAWTRNEEMVDWLALQGSKVYQAWKEANAL